MEILIGIVILALVAAFVAAPFRDRAAGKGSAGAGPAEDAARANLEASKQAKYREIRDTELDRAQGKLSEEEFRLQDAELRAEAIAILREIDALDGSSSEPERPPGGGPGASRPADEERNANSV